MSEEILYIARRQMRSILDVCEQFGDRSKLQNTAQNDLRKMLLGG